MYDLAILGAGPAGLNASIYASRYGMKSVVIGAVAGGLASTTHEVGNWLGTQKISGFELAQQMLAHSKSFGTPIIERMVDSIERTSQGFTINISGHDPIESKTIMLAMGTNHRHLGVPGEHEKLGKGVSYCATCDGFFYRGKTVAVIGGNDSAAGAAVYMGDIAEKVYLIYRKDKLKAEAFWQEAIAKNPKIEVVYNTSVLEIKGEAKVEKLLLSQDKDGSNELAVNGIFIEIGAEPNTELVSDLGVATDEQGFVIIDAAGATSAAGIWAAGDMTTGSNKMRQIITAAAEGAIATASIQKYLKQI